jgi:hypothetical protein
MVRASTYAMVGAGEHEYMADAGFVALRSATCFTSSNGPGCRWGSAM